MARYIDLDKVLEWKNNFCNTNFVSHCNRNCAECFYNNGGAEDVAPVIHAKWMTKPEPYNLTYDCSHCGGTHAISNYCPNCGAKMDKE